jgi:hypothetical protein
MRNSSERPAAPPDGANDRRSASPFNRARRFINNYWLVPVVVVYLQLLAALMNVQGTGDQGFVARNRAFLEGIPLTARILVHDFPYAALGHGKALVYHLAERAEAVPAMVVAESVRDQRHEIYRAILASRGKRDTEVGGVVMAEDDAGVRLRPVASSNGTLIRRIDGLPPDEVLALLRKPENRPIVDALAGGAKPVERIARIVDDPKLAQDQRDRAFSSFLYSLEVASESRYVVLPMTFRATLGRIPGWGYLGMYHFHNELDSPPSDADIAASEDVRQLVFTLAPDGFDLYDIYRGRATVSHHQVTPDPGVRGPDGPARV